VVEEGQQGNDGIDSEEVPNYGTEEHEDIQPSWSVEDSDFQPPRATRSRPSRL
jgi:hypothetical protein